MRKAPLVSVVTSVRNGADQLPATMDSILAQEGAPFEFIVVNDGSKDETASILEEYARRDDRVRVFHQEPMGLTQALIAGCAEARGTFIARQDCGDRSAPHRLARQVELLERNPDAVMASVGARFLGPRNETLYEIEQSSADLQQGLAGTTLKSLRGPSHHGATMFRRTAYDAVGGYRAAFEVAQDLDLWLRMAELGPCLALPALYYEASLAFGAISHLRRGEQLRATRVILECVALRRRGESDQRRIEAWREQETQRARLPAPVREMDRARFHYFIASVLRRRDAALAREYYRQSLQSFFWQPKVWLRLMALRIAR